VHLHMDVSHWAMGRRALRLADIGRVGHRHLKDRRGINRWLIVVYDLYG
jgi:hypothetical protein